jgi:hypothetical protein
MGAGRVIELIQRVLLRRVSLFVECNFSHDGSAFSVSLALMIASCAARPPRIIYRGLNPLAGAKPVPR